MQRNSCIDHSAILTISKYIKKQLLYAIFHGFYKGFSKSMKVYVDKIMWF
ncbi:MAG: hypothetical protein QW224_02405 [Desulfurococcaceae archaeon]